MMHSRKLFQCFYPLFTLLLVINLTANCYGLVPTLSPILSEEELWNENLKGKTSLISCVNMSSQISIPVPSPPSCSDKTKSQTTDSRPSPVIIYKQDLSNHQLNVTYCQKYDVSKKCSTSFLGYQEKDESTSYLFISSEECLELINRSKESPSSHLQWKDGWLIVGYEPDYPCSWFSTATEVNQIIKIHQSTVTYNPRTGEVRHGYDVAQGCHYRDTVCGSDETGRIFWTVTNLELKKSECLVIPVVNTTAIIHQITSQSQLIISLPSISLSLILSPATKAPLIYCSYYNLPVFLSDSGYLFSLPGFDGIHLGNIMFNNAEHHWVNHSLETMSRISKTIDSPLSFDIAQMNYELLLLSDMTSSERRMLEQQICHNSQLQWTQAWSLRHIFPEMSVQLFTRDPYITGYIEGGMMRISACQEVHHWRLVKQGQCQQLWQVSYKDKIIGCLEAKTNIIRECPLKCDPKSSDFLIRIQKNTDLNIAVTPFKKISIRPYFEIKDEISFLPPVKTLLMYDAETLMNKRGIDEFLGFLHDRVLSLEKSVGTYNHTTSFSSSSSGSPGFFAAMGFLVGKVSNIGRLIWFLAAITIVILWGIGFFLLIKFLKVKTCTKRNSHNHRNKSSPATLTVGNKNRFKHPALHNNSLCLV